MSANINIFLVITNTARTILKPLMDEGDLTAEVWQGKLQHLTAVRIFRKMAGRSHNEDRWLKPVLGGKKRHLYSITLPASQKAKEAIKYLKDNYSDSVDIAGAWHWDGRQVGTHYDENGNLVGTPTHPIDQAQLLKFMPPIITYDENGLPTGSTPATVITDVLLEQDCAPRDFN